MAQRPTDSTRACRDTIKTIDGWENEIAADIRVAKTDIFGMYTVCSRTTHSRKARRGWGNAQAYMRIFDINKDLVKNPEMTKVG